MCERGAPPASLAFLLARAGLYQARDPERRWRRRLVPSSTRARLSKPNLMTDDVETRRRRAAYRACHRGTKEMDWILGRFAHSALPAMSGPSLGLFERM